MNGGATPVEHQVNHLVELYSKGLYDDMIDYGRVALAKHPSSFVLWNVLGTAYKALGELDQAISAYQHALHINSDYAPAHNNMGNALKGHGNLVGAIQYYNKALALDSNYFAAQFNLGAALRAEGRIDDAIIAYERALVINPVYAEAYFNLANAFLEKGKFNDAINSYKAAVALKPDYITAERCLASLLRKQGMLAEAIEAYKRVLLLDQNDLLASISLADTLKQFGKFDEAVLGYKKVTSIKPDYYAAYINMGNAMKSQGKLTDSVAAYMSVLEAEPNNFFANINLANTLKDLGDLNGAIAAWQRVLLHSPNHSATHNNIGLALTEKGSFDYAAEAFNRAISLNPKSHDAYNNLAITFMKQGKLEEARSAFQQALHLNSRSAEIHNNLGVVFVEQGNFSAAVSSLKRATEINPAYAVAYNNLGNAFVSLGRLDDAIFAYERALDIKPNYAIAKAQMLHQKTHVCDFSTAHNLPEASSWLGISTDCVPPFAALSWMDAPMQQLERARNWVATKFPWPSTFESSGPRKRHSRIKIGLFSADFHDHATMYLLAGFFRNANKDTFELFVYSYGRHKSGEWRKRAKSCVDHFIDVSGLSDIQIVELSRDQELDIAIDLKGFTTNARTGLFQYRVAPIQINYLGYPGTMGANFIDYIIADPIVIPADQRKVYLEKIIYLPHSYQPNDNLREIATTKSSRSDFGLPDEGIVFCCFNNNYKISPREFDIWMRLLSKIDGSVLWLLKSNKWAEQNLRKEALQRGIIPERLIFAQKVSHAEHLARQRHADLFLDTFNYNAHTTASDALWGGLPLVTKQGKQFAARVASSLLTAVGLPELITYTEEEYESLIFRLATHPEDLAFIRSKLEESKHLTPLFDTENYVRDFEQGLLKAYELYCGGENPKDIWVGKT